MSGPGSSPRGIVYCVLVAFSLTLGGAHAAHGAEQPVVALVTEQRNEMPWIDLAEAALAGDARITLVDREHLDKVLREQKLSLLASSTGGVARTQIGRLLGCDLLIIVRHDADAPAVARVVIADTRTGIRLVNVELPVKALSDAQKLPPELLTSALKRRAIGNPIILAIPPFSNDDLVRQNQFLQTSLATVCEAVAAHHARILLVELDEARELAKENALTGRKAGRALPHYLLGRFRLEAGNERRPPLVTLKLDRGDVTLAEKKIDSPTTASIGAFVQKAAGALLATLSDKDGPQTDNSADAATLARQSQEFLTMGDLEQAAKLAEASLLLVPEQVDLRRDLADTYSKLAYVQYDDPKMDKQRLDRQFARALSFAERGLYHLPIYLDGTKIDRHMNNVAGSNLFSFSANRESDENIRAAVQKHTHDTREIFVEALLTRARRGDINSFAVHGMLFHALDFYRKEDGELEPVMTARLRLLPIAEKVPELRRFIYDEILTHGILPEDPRAQAMYKTWTGSSDPLLAAAATKALSEEENRQAAQHRRDLAMRSEKQKSPPPQPKQEGFDASNVSVRFTPVDIDYREGARRVVIRLQGIQSDRRDNEVAWGFEEKRVVLQRHGAGPFRKMFEADRGHSFGDGCFDGDYVWIPVSAADAQVLRVDPANGAIIKVAAEHGLPQVKFQRAIAAPLERGRIALVACFGPPYMLRSFVAEITSQQSAAPRVRIVHEAREDHANPDRVAFIAERKKNTNLAYSPNFVLPLRDQAGSAASRLFIARALPGPGHDEAMIVDLRSGEATPSPAVSDTQVLHDNVVIHDNAAYWLHGHKLWRVTADKPLERKAMANIDDHDGTLHIEKDGILFIGYQCWFSGSWSQPLRRVPSNPEKLGNAHTHSLHYGGRLGPLLSTNWGHPQVYRLEILRQGPAD